jgi:Rad3-related DNA helicase
MFNSEKILKTFEQQFPFPTIRSEQRLAFERLAPWLESLFADKFTEPLHFGMDLPTGCGKSPLAIDVALSIQKLLEETDWDFKQIWVVTANKLLQDQYQRDFSEDVYDLRGLDNYPCDFDPGKTCGTSKCARKSPKNKEDANPPEDCAKTCGYDRAKSISKTKPILLLNVAKAFTMLNQPFQYDPPLLMIFDEGHNVESALDNEAGISFDPRDLERIHYRFEKYFSELWNAQKIPDGLKKLSQDIGQDLSEQYGRPADLRDIPVIKKMESITKKYETYLKYQEAGIEFIQCSEEKIDLRPLKVHLVFREVFRFPTIFLSATLLSKTGFKSITGLTDDNLDWFGVGSPFPKENRPMYNFWGLGAKPLNYGNMKDEFPNLLERVRRMMDRHPDERGIIHTHTYNIANQIYEKIGHPYNLRLLYPKTAPEQREALEQHKKNPRSVLISPSMTEGVDLKDDLCRFAGMCKVPYLPTNDPVVAARMEEDPNWYAYRTAMTVVQAPGRGVRSPDDYCATYFLDPAFLGFINRAAHLFPSWFLESWQKKAIGGI